MSNETEMNFSDIHMIVYSPLNENNKNKYRTVISLILQTSYLVSAYTILL